MQPVKIIIADDESEARKLILFYLEQSGISCQINEAINGADTLDLMQRESPDILFLDMKMPGLTGMDVIRYRGNKKLPAIIFTTAFDQYALVAFDFDAIDYLLKPFDGERFLKSLNKAIRYLEYLHLNADKEKLQTLSIKIGSRTIVLRLLDIEYFSASGPYIRVVTNGKTYLLHKPLYELQHGLPGNIFFRIHRSCIVNRFGISEIKSLLNGDYSILLKSGKELRASRTYRENLRSVFGKI